MLSRVAAGRRGLQGRARGRGSGADGWGRRGDAAATGSPRCSRPRWRTGAWGRSPEAAERSSRRWLLAEPDDASRVFLDAGQPVRSAMTVLVPPTSRCAGFAGPDPGALRRPAAACRRGRARAAEVPLTDSELAVLRFLPSHMTNQEIAEALFLSINTVKTHCGRPTASSAWTRAAPPSPAPAAWTSSSPATGHLPVRSILPRSAYLPVRPPGRSALGLADGPVRPVLARWREACCCCFNSVGPTTLLLRRASRGSAQSGAASRVRCAAPARR